MGAAFSAADGAGSVTGEDGAGAASAVCFAPTTPGLRMATDDVCVCAGTVAVVAVVVAVGAVAAAEACNAGAMLTVNGR